MQQSCSLAAHKHSHLVQEMFSRSVSKDCGFPVARRTVHILETVRSTCPDAQFILRGLGPKHSGPDDMWPNIYTVV